MSTTPELALPKSELLFLYESTYSIPNGDPFTGEQRFDEETKRVLVSDVRIKRFIRDYLIDLGKEDIYVRNDRSNVKAKAEGETAESGAAARFNTLEAANPNLSAEQLLTRLIDVRLFGGISTKTGKAVNLTGPVQFALLNPSLNAVDLRMHQNTSVFASKTDNTRGAIGTTTVVPYALCQIHGWINPYSARHTNLTQDDVQTMFGALWNSINNANTRTKSNQSSLLLLQIVYAEPTRKVYGLGEAIKLTPGSRDDNPLRGEQIRSREDYSLNFDRLREIAASPAVSEVRFYTEADDLREQLSGDKFRAMKI